MIRGELYRVRHPAGDPKRSRVFVVVGRSAVIESTFSRVICAPVYTRRQGAATEVHVGIEDGLKHDSSVYCDVIESVPKSQLTDYVGVLSPYKLTQLRTALRIALAVE